MSVPIKYIQFGTLLPEEWLRISVAEITKPSSKGGSDKDRHETPYDERMGVLENGKECLTCRYGNKECLGHYGHINLPIAIYNRQFFKIITYLLQSVCPRCSRLRMKPEQIVFQGLMRLKKYNRLREIAKKSSNIETCPWEDCLDSEGGPNPLPSFSYERITDEIILYYGRKKDAEKTPFSAERTLSVFLRITNEHLKILGFNEDLTVIEPENLRNIFLVEPKEHPHQFRPESLIFWKVFPVIPPISRPFVVNRDSEETCDDDITDKYNSIIKIIVKLTQNSQVDVMAAPSSSKSKRKTVKLKESDYQHLISQLESHIWTLMDNKQEKSKLSSGGRPHKCISQRLGGKDGHIQGNIGGKRVDFSARSVIVGGGIMLRVDQLGVPKFIAEKLTKPEFVGEWNMEYIQNLVYNRKINRIVRNGRIIRIQNLPKTFSVRLGDIAERQLQDGDWVLFNRQPTLRIESMQSFQIKIIDGYSFRLPLAVTPPFNADKLTSHN